jgi:hypothetical protein
MKNHDLMRRRNVLGALGSEANASRSSWSHDFGDTITFDAWEHRWLPSNVGQFGRYPLRTNGEHYNLSQSRKRKRQGHTRWQRHVDLILEGRRQARAIVPVARDLNAANKSAQGWLPLAVEGSIKRYPDDEVWFHSSRIVRIRNVD